MEKMVGMGMDMMQVKDFLEDKCIHEENPELLLDWLDRPTYVNALKSNYMPPHNPNAAFAQGYNYVPNQNMGGMGVGGNAYEPVKPQPGYNTGYNGNKMMHAPVGGDPRLIQQP